MTKQALQWSIIGSVSGVVIVAGIIIAIYASGGFSRPAKPAPEAKTPAEAGPPTPKPTGKFMKKGADSPNEPWLSPYQFIAAPGGNAGDGAEQVTALINAFKEQDPDVLTRLMGDSYRDYEAGRIDGNTNLLWTVRCADKLAESADQADFSFALNAADLKYEPPQELIAALDFIWKSALIEGRIFEKKSNAPKAESIYRAVLIFGVRLAGSGTRLGIQEQGLEAIVGATAALQKVLAGRDAAKAKAAEAFQAAIEKFYQDYIDVQNGDYLPGQKGLFFQPYDWDKPDGKRNAGAIAGDLIQMAKSHPNPAWRIEAIMHLGMFRLSPNGKPMRSEIDTCLLGIAKGADPVMKAAAGIAIQFTKADFDEQTQKR